VVLDALQGHVGGMRDDAALLTFSRQPRNRQFTPGIARRRMAPDSTRGMRAGLAGGANPVLVLQS
jgi:hypothetical protein